MMNRLLQFELANYIKKAGFFIAAAAFFGLGFLTATKARLVAVPGVFLNSAYNITYVIGLFNLISIFVSTVLAVQILFREQDARFSLMLYATPIRRMDYLWSRFLAVFGITVFLFLVLVFGTMTGHQMPWLDRTSYAPFQVWHYIQPVLLLALPNALFCAAVVCFAGWWSRNKLVVYISGVFVYIAYMAALIFSGSPLIAGGFPPSATAMDMSAKFDPFGLSAFFYQTQYWTAVQRNYSLIGFSGNMLFNRLFFIGLSLVLLWLGFKKFQFHTDEKQRKTTKSGKLESAPGAIFRPVYAQVFTPGYYLHSLISLVKTDIKFIVKSIPFYLMLAGIGFYISMEMYSYVDKGVRLPENYASTGLMANTILKTFPGLCLIAILFYSSELMWRSRTAHFDLIEDATPARPLTVLLARWMSMSGFILLLLFWVVVIALFFQMVFGYFHIDWLAYLQLIHLTALPLLLASGVVLVLQSLFRHKYAGLAVSVVVLLVMNTNAGKMLGVTHPLLRFSSSFAGLYSDMNGWGSYLDAFNMRMLYGAGMTLLLVLLVGFKDNFKKMRSPLPMTTMAAALLCAAIPGVLIFQKVVVKNKNAELDLQQQYEQKYRPFQALPQPTVTAVATHIDLFPSKNTWQCSGKYSLKNNTGQPLDKVLIYIEKGVETDLNQLILSNARPAERDEKLRHYWFQLASPLMPGDTGSLSFVCRYDWSPFEGHEPFNAIVENGTFIRISNYFPRFGYQQENEIADENERTKRGLGPQTALPALDAPRSTTHDFIDLDMTLSTEQPQTAIGIGECTGQWQAGGRNYFRYLTSSPVPFRFAVASANYAVEKSTFQGKKIEVFYHPAHPENVQHLIENAQHTLEYCSKNFGPYPFETIRFAEVSSFTRGFAATAYPASIFMTEDMVFHANIQGDKQQDVINELAGHELSHEWWGGNQLSPDYREGSKFLTETLAMYTELMLVKKMYGRERVLENVRMHREIYLSERGFTDEQPLCRTWPENTHLHYSKGLVAMYQLSVLIGEEKVNAALKNLLTKHAYPHQPPVSTDLLREFYAVSDTVFYEKIEELFEKIVTWNIDIQSVKSERYGGEFNIEIAAEVIRWEEDGKGNTTRTPFSGEVQAVVYLKSGETKWLNLHVAGNQIKTDINLPSAPVKMIFDPNELLLKRGGGGGEFVF